MIHYPHNPEENMRPMNMQDLTGGTEEVHRDRSFSMKQMQSKYRIKEFKGVFTIEKLVRTKVKSKTLCDWLYYGFYRYESDYYILTDRDNLFKPFVEAHPITEKFKSLDEAKARLNEIKSEEESKYPTYHNF